jgi:hypothetical protein
VISLELFDVWCILGELTVRDFKDKKEKPTVKVGYYTTKMFKTS